MCPRGTKSSSASAGSKDPMPTHNLEPRDKKAKLAGSPDMDARMALFLPKWMAANKK